MRVPRQDSGGGRSSSGRVGGREKWESGRGRDRLLRRARLLLRLTHIDLRRLRHIWHGMWVRVLPLQNERERIKSNALPPQKKSD